MIKIITDATNDLSAKFYEDNNIHLIPMELNIDGDILVDNKAVDLHNFYELIRKGKLPTTSMITPSTYEETFEKYLSQGYDVLYIGFSSGLSGSFNASLIAKKSLEEKYPSGKIVCIDSQSASLGIGILVKKALDMRDNNSPIEDIANVLDELKQHIIVFLGVDNLFHLQRGGRVSKTAAIVGTALQLKPIIKLNEEGKLVSYKKVMGRKKMAQSLIDFYAKYYDEYNANEVYVLHGDCDIEAQELKNKLDATFNINAQVFSVGTIIGTHTGANALAIIFLSKQRKDEI